MLIALCGCILCGSILISTKNADEDTNQSQESRSPDSYREEEISYESPSGIKLAGTLTLPKSEGPHPVVLLITGFGAPGQNEMSLAHKSFLVLTSHLTRQGIAVLRLHDKGINKSIGTFAATDAGFGADALAGINYLKTRKEINPKQIGLIDYSEWGLIAPAVAAKSQDISFIVLMTPPAGSGERVLLEQAAKIQHSAGFSDELIKEEQKLREKIFAILKKETDLKIAEKRLQEAVVKYLEGLPAPLKKETDKLAGVEIGSKKNIDLTIEAINTPWFRYFLRLDPKVVLKQIKIPVLALDSEQVEEESSSGNISAIIQILKEAGNIDYTTLGMPKLRHLFQNSETASIEGDEKTEEILSPAVLNLITDWVLEKTVQQKPK